MAEWLKATDCKSVLSEYEGSNPSPSTIICSACVVEEVLPVGDGDAGVAQLVELQFSKLNVASSSLVARSKIWVCGDTSQREYKLYRGLKIVFGAVMLNA